MPVVDGSGVMERLRKMGSAKLNERKTEERRLAMRIKATIERLAESISEGFEGRFILVRVGPNDYKVGFEPADVEV